MWRQLLYSARASTIRPARYRNLLKAVHQRRPRSIVELGAHNGRNACRMIETAALFAAPSEIHYYGFDLFEMLTEDDLVKEFSLRPPARAEVQQRLERTGANIHLFQGYSQETLPKLASDERASRGVDFVFLDGGHSLETIASDWANVLRVMTPETVVVLDDYYPGTEPEVQQLGCRTLVESLDRQAFEVDVLDTEDHFRKDWGVLRVQMVRVRKRPATAAASPASATGRTGT